MCCWPEKQKRMYIQIWNVKVNISITVSFFLIFSISSCLFLIWSCIYLYEIVRSEYFSFYINYNYIYNYIVAVSLFQCISLLIWAVYCGRRSKQTSKQSFTNSHQRIILTLWICCQFSHQWTITYYPSARDNSRQFVTVEHARSALVNLRLEERIHAGVTRFQQVSPALRSSV